ncbi:DUF3817 domain-containing protein [Brachybacterium endophyticum]|uniref:DUF3817 domain-containing protein n=1 Tax=Brachybacterium endophyticum TaxID=2182385 RepID=A0A2U2RP22_9MICO|nr:DUF3817 domain-containing protein [Brachybacterium endophyticum]PWH07610.1 DUF3817 domain-containing protein [Brachybacterium endophyticum]
MSGGNREIATVGRVFAIVAFAEAVTWAGLLVGMVLKYGPVGTEAGVWLFGRLHGGVFVAYVAVALVAAVRLRWRWWVALLALACSVPPLVTVPLEIWLRRTGRLDRRRDDVISPSPGGRPSQADTDTLEDVEPTP